MTVSIVYVTAPDQRAAKAIGRTLVEERLAACVNLFNGMTSIFRWEGQIEEAGEAVLIAKTRSELVDSVTARIRELHPYDCPCIVSWPIENGHAAYLNWIRDETGAT